MPLFRRNKEGQEWNWTDKDESGYSMVMNPYSKLYLTMVVEDHIKIQSKLLYLQGDKKIMDPPIIQNMAYFKSFYTKVVQKFHIGWFICGK